MKRSRAASETRLQESAKIGNLSEQARSIIRTMISTGELEPEKIYITSHFSQLLGISFTLIREALFDLVNEGLLEGLKNQGFRVPSISRDNLYDTVELRMMLEVPTIGRLAGNLPEDVARECKKICVEIECSAEKGDLDGFLNTDRQFYLRLLETYGNYRLVEIISRLGDQG